MRDLGRCDLRSGWYLPSDCEPHQRSPWRLEFHVWPYCFGDLARAVLSAFRLSSPLSRPAVTSFNWTQPLSLSLDIT